MKSKNVCVHALLSVDVDTEEVQYSHIFKVQRLNPKTKILKPKP